MKRGVFLQTMQGSHPNLVLPSGTKEPHLLENIKCLCNVSIGNQGWRLVCAQETFQRTAKGKQLG